MKKYISILIIVLFITLTSCVVPNNPSNQDIYEENGRKYVYFGSYPQTHVNDTELINELNKLTTVNSRGYYEYNGLEYAKVTTKPHFYGSTDYTYSTGKVVEYGVTEWFKIEPIVWRILSTSNNTYQILSEYILDASCYYHDYDAVRTIDGKTVYANNYKYSDIREFLNNTFLNSAFTTNEKSLIVVTEVDNGANTTYSSSNPYVCENTFDKIYLLSYQDTLNTSYGFSSSWSEYDVARRAVVTDYAKAMGVSWDTFSYYYNMSVWWLRSPYYSHSNSAGVVHSCGDVDSLYGVYYSFGGVRPATAMAIQ